MLQNLKVFGRKNDPVDHADYGVALPGTEPVVQVATEKSDAGVAKRGTYEDLKNVKGPSQEELEADFAFISNVLAKAQVAEPTSAAPSGRRADDSVVPTRPVAPVSQVKTRVTTRTVTRPLQSTAPSFVPLHKRGNGPNGGPMHAVQSAPRSLTPAFLQEEEELLAPAETAEEDMEPDAGDPFAAFDPFEGEETRVAKADSTHHDAIATRPVVQKPNLPSELFEDIGADADDILADFPEPPAVMRKLLRWIPSTSRAVEA